MSPIAWIMIEDNGIMIWQSLERHGKVGPEQDIDPVRKKGTKKKKKERKKEKEKQKSSTVQPAGL